MGRNRSNSNKNKNRPKSLKYQMETAVLDNFNEGKSKRAAKMSEGGYGSKIYSHSTKNNLLDFVGTFASFCKSQYGIKNVKDVKSEHAKAFMEKSAKTCNDNSMREYHQHLKKLDKCFKATFKSYKNDLTSGWKLPSGKNQTKLRDVKIERESMNKVLDKLDMKYGTHRAIALAEALGLRVSEAVMVKGSHINLDKGVVHVIGKGGRPRQVPIREDRKEILVQLKEQYGDTRIALVKENSVNATFKRICKREEIHDLDGSKSGIHAIRKLYATEQFEELVDNGMDEKRAFDEVSAQIGHGENRNDLFKTYIVR